MDYDRLRSEKGPAFPHCDRSRCGMASDFTRNDRGRFSCPLSTADEDQLGTQISANIAQPGIHPSQISASTSQPGTDPSQISAST